MTCEGDCEKDKNKMKIPMTGTETKVEKSKDNKRVKTGIKQPINKQTQEEDDKGMLKIKQMRLKSL